MKSITARFLTVASISLLFSACDRAPSDVSRVSLQLPMYSSSGASSKTGVDALACNPCLKSIIVNVNGGDFKTITYNQQHADLEEDGTQLSGEVVLEVPAGPGREIQILALYKNNSAGDDVTMQYGSTVVDLLSAEPPPVVMKLTNLGAFRGGSIQGRFLTGTDSGPTGRVKMELDYKGIHMEMFTGDILNGWFSFFAAHDRFPLTYRLAETGEVLFSNLTTESFKASGTGQQALHFTRSGPYWEQRGGDNTREQVTETHDLIYGFFSRDPALISSKAVCIQVASGDESLSRVFSGPSSGDQSLTYSNSSPSAKFFGTGGRASNDGWCSGGTTNMKSFELNQITLRKDQFNGQGNDTARAIAGAFSYFVNASGDVTKYETGSTPLEFKLKTLPGLFSGNKPLFDNIKLFKKPNGAGGGYDNVRCDEKWLDSKGFREVGDFANVPTFMTFTPASDEVTFTLSELQNGTDGYIVCPTEAGGMRGLGGMYLGSLGPTPAAKLVFTSSPSTDPTLSSYQFSNTSTASSNYQTFYIHNQGNAMATALTGLASSLNLKFKGGSFPGVSGDCTSSLAAGASCAVSVEFAPTSYVDYTGTLNFSYTTSNVPGQSAVLELKGTGIP